VSLKSSKMPLSTKFEQFLVSKRPKTFLKSVQNVIS
jgi:hypothetical protein